MKMDMLTVVEKAREFVSKMGYDDTKITSIDSDETSGTWKVAVDVSSLFSSIENIKMVTIADSDGRVIEFK